MLLSFPLSLLECGSDPPLHGAPRAVFIAVEDDACPPSSVARCPRRRWELWRSFHLLRARICVPRRAPCISCYAVAVSLPCLILSCRLPPAGAHYRIRLGERRCVLQQGCSTASVIMTCLGTLRTLCPGRRNARVV